jgi:hypothetical protein
MIQRPFIYLTFESTLTLEETAARISERLFPGVPFGLPDGQFDEFPSVRLTSCLLGCDIDVIQSPNDPTSFTLQMMTRVRLRDREVTVEEHVESLLKSEEQRRAHLADISDYVAVLLKDIDGFSVSQPDTER